VKKSKERREVRSKKAKRPRYKKDVSKVRCYNCKKLGHYASQFAHKDEQGKQHANAANIEESTPQDKVKESKDEEYVF
jgi:hypothetical protein